MMTTKTIGDRILRRALGLESWGAAPPREQTYTGPHPLTNPHCRIAQAIRGDRDFDLKPPYVPLSEEDLQKLSKRNFTYTFG